MLFELYNNVSRILQAPTMLAHPLTMTPIGAAFLGDLASTAP